MRPAVRWRNVGFRPSLAAESGPTLAACVFKEPRKEGVSSVSTAGIIVVGSVALQQTLRVWGCPDILCSISSNRINYRNPDLTSLLKRKPARITPSLVPWTHPATDLLGACKWVQPFMDGMLGEYACFNVRSFNSAPWWTRLLLLLHVFWPHPATRGASVPCARPLLVSWYCSPATDPPRLLVWFNFHLASANVVYQQPLCLKKAFCS